MNSQQSLFLSDHIWVIENFRKQAGSQAFHPVVTDILRRYLPRESFKVHIDAKGKPRMLCDTGSFYFSLSHSREVLVLFLSHDGDIGVDVEFLQDRRYQHKISARYFGDKSMDTLNFYRHWTAREAFVKAVGCGIDKNFENIHINHQAQESLIGFKNQFSHQIKFLPFNDQYLIATCRGQNLSSKKIAFAF